jgi:hypothetical protein
VTHVLGTDRPSKGWNRFDTATCVAIDVGSFAALKVVALGFSTATCAALFVVGRLFFGIGA